MSSITAIALGNPEESPIVETIPGHGDNEIEFLKLIFFPSDENGTAPGKSAKTYLIWKGDIRRYDVGNIIVISYVWNEEEEDCVENTLLRNCDFFDLEMFRNEIHPKIKTLLPVTYVEVKTVNRSLSIAEVPPIIPEDKAYPPVPPILASVIPSVPISNLRRCKLWNGPPNIDPVTISGDPSEAYYAFKRYIIPLEEEEAPMGLLLSEVEVLCQFDSPYIIKPSFVVTDDSMSLFRGYLMPFMPAGTLQHLFHEITTEGLVIEEPLSLEERQRQQEEGRTTTPNLPWSIKHTWAIEAASALVTLHERAVYSGDVKLSNILLGRDGHLRLIDVAPQDGFTLEYMPPEVNPLTMFYPWPLTEARDIFAFGVVLWQIAEEQKSIEREDPTLPLLLSWRSHSVREATPQWYRDLVQTCIDTNPEKRPRAREILAVLGQC